VTTLQFKLKYLSKSDMLKLAATFEVPLSTVERWATGAATPQRRLAALIVAEVKAIRKEK
jgi:DNA-binding transcriptional regulator YiaG